MTEIEAARPVFSPHLFWDSDLERIDFQRDKNKIIRRVFEYGLEEDVVEALWFYKKEELVNALISASSLSQSGLMLASLLFQIKPDTFKCSTSKPLHPLS